MIEGAAMTTPVAMARENRKRSDVSRRVLLSKRRSRYAHRGVDVGTPEERDHRQGQDHHRNRQAEVELDERETSWVTWPVPTSVMAESCVAITDRPTAHHGRIGSPEVTFELVVPPPRLSRSRRSR